MELGLILLYLLGFILGLISGRVPYEDIATTFRRKK